MTSNIAPPTLPRVIFIIPDANRPNLAWEVATTLAAVDSRVIHAGFLEPVYDSLTSMFNLHYSVNPANPDHAKTTVGEPPIPLGDLAKELGRWFTEHFDPSYLGRLAGYGYKETAELMDCSLVLRDATREWMEGFRHAVGMHDQHFAYIWLSNLTMPGANRSYHFHPLPGEDASAIVKRFVESI